MANDQYGKPLQRYDESKNSGVFGDSLANLRANPVFNIDKLGLSRLMLELDAKNHPEYLNNGPLTPAEKAARAKMNADAKKLGAAKKVSLAKAAKKVVKPAPKPAPRTKGGPIAPSKPSVGKNPAPMPTKPDIKTKNAPMPYNKKTYVPRYGGA
jgi:hypothetical protein